MNLSSHLPKKSLGQHFLIHQGIQQRIVDGCGLLATDTVVEIGPGKGAITDKIAQRVKRVVAIEKDRVLAGALRERFDQTHVEVTEADVLEFDFSHLPAARICVGNLPYNVAAPIIEKVLTSGKFERLYAMVQLEHGHRMLAGPGSKEYGSLSCFVQFYSRTRKLFEIRPSAFQPPPKVQSVFIEFDIYPPDRRPIQNVPEDDLLAMIRAAFLQRRKTILNALGFLAPKETLSAVLKDLNIPEQTRAEQICLMDFVRIFRAVKPVKP